MGMAGIRDWDRWEWQGMGMWAGNAREREWQSGLGIPDKGSPGWVEHISRWGCSPREEESGAVWCFVVTPVCLSLQDGLDHGPEQAVQ